jgi:anti-anti-sigma factor
VTPYELEVRQADPEEATLVDIAGELDLMNAAEVERRLLDVGSSSSGLFVDLNRVTFVDSAALHMLFRVARRIGEEQRFGIVLEPTALVARTLAIVGLDGVASVRPTIAELVAEPS